VDATLLIDTVEGVGFGAKLVAGREEGGEGGRGGMMLLFPLFLNEGGRGGGRAE